jgi:hypothetical protein
VSHKTQPPSRQRGIALVEIALMGVISAVLLGGILQGQALIANARVRSVIALGEKARAATLAFEDRYRALPGDYAYASDTIPGVTFNGNGNGRIEPNGSPLGPAGTQFESLLAWHHMSRAGFLGESYTFDPGTPAIGLPPNVWGGYADLAYDTRYGDPTAPPIARHTLKTGNFVPSAVLVEVDRKLDDGNGLGGGFQFSDMAWGGDAPVGPGGANGCVLAGGQWSLAGAPVNCGGAWLL